MSEHIEIWGPGGVQLQPLVGERMTVGASDANDLALPWDRTVSRLHAVLERFPAGWSIHDLGSTNGTTVNGEALAGPRALRPGDQVRVGSTQLVYRAGRTGSVTATEAAEPAPDLTRRERDVLLELCAPVLSQNVLSEPATVQEIATNLVLTESAIKKHLLRLYDKFGLDDDSGRRRARLANDAIRRGAVTLADLRARAER